MSIIEQARTELKTINFGDDDTRVMIEILEKFFEQWDSGGAVWAAAPVLQRLIAGKPLSPLTGKDDEWIEVSDREFKEGGREYGIFQNKRCPTVFKQERPDLGEGLFAYDIDVPGRPAITFPYWPDKAEVDSPVVEVTAI